MGGKDVVIVAAVRTPIGEFCGCLSSLNSFDLGSVVIKESLAKVNLPPTDVSEIIFGQVLTAGQGQNPVRQAAIKAGIPITAPAYQLNMLCGSGIRAIANAYLTIKCGEGDIIIAGGQESMSRAPHVINLRNGVKLGDANFTDSLLYDGLTDAFEGIHMGITAENVAKKFDISREDQDKYAVQSQQRTAAAIRAGYFDKEIVPVTVCHRKQSIVVSKDEFPKPDTNIDVLKKLKPAFLKTNGTVTAGNASGICDGAAAVILMSADTAAAKGIQPLGRIVAIAQTGIEPGIMGMGPVSSVELALKKAKWTKEEVDLYEINEAFAAQCLACIRELNLNFDKVNVNGGALALGHPIGCSGARIVVTLLHALERTGGRKGIASLCIGGGMGIALAVERT